MPQLGCAVGNVHYRFGGEPTLLCVCLGKVKSEARSDQLITFAGFFGEALPIKYLDLPATALNQTCAFQLSGSIRDGWALNAQHFAKLRLGQFAALALVAKMANQAVWLLPSHRKIVMDIHTSGQDTSNKLYIGDR